MNSSSLHCLPKWRFYFLLFRITHKDGICTASTFEDCYEFGTCRRVSDVLRNRLHRSMGGSGEKNNRIQSWSRSGATRNCDCSIRWGPASQPYPPDWGLSWSWFVACWPERTFILFTMGEKNSSEGFILLNMSTISTYSYTPAHFWNTKIFKENKHIDSCEFLDDQKCCVCQLQLAKPKSGHSNVPPSLQNVGKIIAVTRSTVLLQQAQRHTLSFLVPGHALYTSIPFPSAAKEVSASLRCRATWRLHSPRLVVV